MRLQKDKLESICRQDAQGDLEDMQELVGVADGADERKVVEKRIERKIFSKGKQERDYGSARPKNNLGFG